MRLASKLSSAKFHREIDRQKDRYAGEDIQGNGFQKHVICVFENSSDRSVL